MARKPKKEKKEKSIKTLWDHLSHIYKVQDPNYFKTLSESDKKTFNKYIINRAISMNIEWVEVINYIQRFYELDDELYYRILIEAIPQGNYYFPYIKEKNPSPYNSKLVELFSNYFQLKKSEVIDYLHIFYNTDSGKKEVKKICKKYALEDNEIDEMCKLKNEL